jgi:flagellar biosynthesis/type III secretory pathway chaperone
LEKLLTTMEAMIHRYQQLLETLQEEKGLIIEGNLGDLSICLIEKEKLLGELKRLEATRLREIEPLSAMVSPRPMDVTTSAEAGRPEWTALPPQSASRPSGLTLRQLIRWVSSPYQERLSSCYERLRALSASVSEINQINGLLSVRILQQVNSLLGLLTHLSAMPSIYQSSGFFHHDLQGGPASARGYGSGSTGMFHLHG